MRDILFRGKRIDNGDWVKGDLIHRQVWRSYIAIIRVRDDGFDNYLEYEVNPSTVGQYTGLTDKNGKKIFEGDVVEGKFKNYVFWFDDIERAFVYGATYQGGYRHPIPEYKKGDYKDLILIGNIYDNPELVEIIDDKL